MNSEKQPFDYLNFDLLIERAGNAYVARVTNSPAGEAATKFNVPFSALELENFLLKIGRPRRGVRRLNSPEMEAAKVFGKRLFESVFGSEVFGCLRSSLDQTEAKGSAGLRLRLRLNAPELADLPWEYLYNPALNRFLVLAVETPVVRYLELPERIRPLAVKPPLKILVMLSGPGDYPSLDVEEEWLKLQDALGDLQKRKLVMLERLDEATLPALQRRLRQSQYNIFHFIGHGGYDESARDGVLLLEDETRHSRRVSGQFLGTILHNHRPLRLAVLNACEGARASRTDPFTGTAQSLVQQGLPAVIAMQFEITDEAAITLSHEFYTALADGYPVDAALVEARTAIFASGNDVEWGTPVLYMRAPDGKIFDLTRVDTPRPRLEETPLPDVAPSAQSHFDEVLTLSQEAERACSAEDWPTAIEKYQVILKLQPDHAEAKNILHSARQELELTKLYNQGREHLTTKRWQQAIESFRRVQEFRENYKEVKALLASAEREWQKEQETQKPKPPTSSSTKPPRSSPRVWLLSGIALTLVVLTWLVYKSGDWGYKGKPETPVETKITRALALRSTPRNEFSDDEAKSMLAVKGLFDSGWNKGVSGFANDYELKTLAGEQVVVDKATGLMWQRGGSSNDMNYADAEKYIRQLNTARFAGFNDWHLPTLEEVMSLMEPSKLNADLYIDPKFDKTQRYIWTADKQIVDVKWAALFDHGFCDVAIALNASVRAVRVGQ